MPDYNILSIINLRTLEQVELLKQDTPAAQKLHDQQLFADVMASVKDFKDWYARYDTLMKDAKLQGKAQMDSVENAFKSSKGKPSPNALVVMRESLEVIENSLEAVERQNKFIHASFLEFRENWPKALGERSFNKQPVATMSDWRQGLINKQAKEWNPITDRLREYASRAKTLVSAAERASGSGQKPGGPGSAEALRELMLAVTKTTNPPSEKTLLETVGTVEYALREVSLIVKKGLIAKVDWAKAPAATWKNRKARNDQYDACRKRISGGIDTLETLLGQAKNGLKSAGKTEAGGWKALAEDIESKLKPLRKGLKEAEDLVKLGPKEVSLFETAIKNEKK